MNKIHYQIGHDFRNLTKLVWYFCDFSTFYYQFYKIIALEQNTKPEREKLCGSACPALPARPATGPATGGLGRGGALTRPQAVAHGATSMAQHRVGVSGPDGVGGGPATTQGGEPTCASVNLQKST